MATVPVRGIGRALLLVVALLPSGPALAAPDANPTATAIRPKSVALETLDVDGNGVVDALTDGVLVMRYLFGVRGPALIRNAVGAGATRATAADIEAYLATLVSALPPPGSPGGCAITAVPSSSPQNPLVGGTQVTLTPNCTLGDGTPTTYSWSFSGTSGIIQTAITVAPVCSTTYTATPSNASGTGKPFSITVYVGDQFPQCGIAPGCAISQSPNSAVMPLSPGSGITLTVTCAGGSAPTACAWNQGIASTACSVTIPVPQFDTTYTATASNAAGAFAPASTTVYTNTFLDPPIFCTGSDQILTLTWPPAGEVQRSTTGFANERIAFRIAIPQTFDPALVIDHLGFVHVSGVPGSAPVARDMTVSTIPCDFLSGSYLYSDIGNGNVAPAADFTVNNPTGYLDAGASFNANSGDTIYVNVRNANSGAPTCAMPPCDIVVDFATPNRY